MIIKLEGRQRMKIRRSHALRENSIKVKAHLIYFDLRYLTHVVFC